MRQVTASELDGLVKDGNRFKGHDFIGESFAKNPKKKLGKLSPVFTFWNF